MNVKFLRPIFLALAVSWVFALALAPAYAQKTLDIIKKRGYVQCGVSGGLNGFSAPDSKGIWKGLDVDLCKALAVAVFGEPTKAKYIPLSAQQRFTALQSGEVDVLTRNTSRTLARETSLGLNFGPVNFYDGQGFMVKKKLGVSKASQLTGATLCIQPGTTTELNVADFFRTQNMKFKPLVIENNEEVFKAFMGGRCDVLTSDASQLAAERTKAPNPADLIILPDIISKEPLAPAVRHGDDNWLDIVSWAFYAMIEAEELGITSKNLAEMEKSKDPRIQRLLGVIPGNGKALGLTEKWAHNIIKHVGNYGESFERHVGSGTTLKLQRGQNALWNQGGLMYAPPLR